MFLCVCFYVCLELSTQFQNHERTRNNAWPWVWIFCRSGRGRTVLSGGKKNMMGLRVQGDGPGSWFRFYCFCYLEFVGRNFLNDRDGHLSVRADGTPARRVEYGTVDSFANWNLCNDLPIL